jgi:NADPH-dependent curcumin reductase CurA
MPLCSFDQQRTPRRRAYRFSSRPRVVRYSVTFYNLQCDSSISSGLTAYFVNLHMHLLDLPIFSSPKIYFSQGLHDIGRIKPTDTLLVSGAAGSVGSLVCQMALKVDARVIGIAGSEAKCAWLEKEVGVHRALNYKDPAFKEALRSIGWIDVYFDNVGGEILDLVLRRLNKGARIVLCGEFCSSRYDAGEDFLSF